MQQPDAKNGKLLQPHCWYTRNTQLDLGVAEISAAVASMFLDSSLGSIEGGRLMNR